jgi:hypothetical protein
MRGLRGSVLRARALLSVVAIVAAAAAVGVGPSASPAGASTTVPHLKHVFTIVLENSRYEDIVSADGRAAMPYLTGLSKQGVSLAGMRAIDHFSLPNYIAMTSGLEGNALTKADCFNYNCVYNMPYGSNVADQLEIAGKSWKGYMESMPTPCAHGAEGHLDPYLGFGPTGGYATRHNPFMYYRDIVGNPVRCKAHDVPFTQFSTDLARNQVPNYSLIVPDTCNDAHNGGETCGLNKADDWLAQHVPAILASSAYKDAGMLVITFDESKTSDTRGCCGTARGGRIFTLVLSPFVPHPGASDPFRYNHFGLLRTIEDGFGLPCLGKACAASTHPFGPGDLRVH